MSDNTMWCYPAPKIKTGMVRGRVAFWTGVNSE